MKFGILEEAQLREAADGRLDRLFDIWHSDLSDKYGKQVDIVLGNRRDSASPVRGGILTNAVIEIKDGIERLIVWYDPLELYYDARIKEIGYSFDVINEITEMLKTDTDPGKDYDPVSNPGKLDINSIAVQVGRWLLKFRGFKKLANENKAYFELETFFNTECGITPLYALLNEAGYDWASTEKKRLTEVFQGLRNMEEPKRRVDIAINALRISNILEFSPDSEEKQGLQEILESGFPRILSVKNEIDRLKKDWNLTDAESLNGFMRKLALKFRLPGSWVSVDETTAYPT